MPANGRTMGTVRRENRANRGDYARFYFMREEDAEAGPHRRA